MRCIVRTDPCASRPRLGVSYSKLEQWIYKGSVRSPTRRAPRIAESGGTPALCNRTPAAIHGPSRSVPASWCRSAAATSPAASSRRSRRGCWRRAPEGRRSALDGRHHPRRHRRPEGETRPAGAGRDQVHGSDDWPRIFLRLALRPALRSRAYSIADDNLITSEPSSPPRASPSPRPP